VVLLSLSACGSSSSYSSSYSSPPTQPKWANITLTGEEEPLLEGTTWIRSAPVYDFESTYEFRAGGRLVRNDDDGDTFTFSWQREDNDITFITSSGFTIYEGKYYPQTLKIMITWKNSEGKT
jgi:hypothetical protein